MAWGDEGKDYNFRKPGFAEETGHFTQLVWLATVEVGCAAVNCGYTENDNKVRRATDGRYDGSVLSPRVTDGSTRAQGWYVVCEYTPAGNVVGQSNKYFKLNVLPANNSQSTTSTTASANQPSGEAPTGHGVDFTMRMILVALGTVGLGMTLYT